MLDDSMNTGNAAFLTTLFSQEDMPEGMVELGCCLQTTSFKQHNMQYEMICGR